MYFFPLYLSKMYKGPNRDVFIVIIVCEHMSLHLILVPWLVFTWTFFPGCRKTKSHQHAEVLIYIQSMIYCTWKLCGRWCRQAPSEIAQQCQKNKYFEGYLTTWRLCLQVKIWEMTLSHITYLLDDFERWFFRPFQKATLEAQLKVWLRR